MVKNGHETKRNKKNNPTLYSPTFLKRIDEVVLNRLRIGHTLFTHAQLMKKEPLLLCRTCGYLT